MRRILWILVVLAVLPAMAAAQDDYEFSDYGDGDYADFDAGAGGLLTNDYLVNSPTALVLSHGEYRFTARMMAGGSIVARTEIGIQGRFSVGVSWGMLGLLGTGDVETYERTGLALRFRLVEEGELPAIAVGFDNQGYGGWHGGLNRYARKSKGFYLAMTRSWYGPLGGELATSAGLNYSLENDDEDSVDAWFGIEQSLDESFSVILDYSLSLNDREEDGAFGEGIGWLDAAFCWCLAENVSFKFFLGDLLKNAVDPVTGDTLGIERQFLICYGNRF